MRMEDFVGKERSDFINKEEFTELFVKMRINERCSAKYIEKMKEDAEGILEGKIGIYEVEAISPNEELVIFRFYEDLYVFVENEKVKFVTETYESTNNLFDWDRSLMVITGHDDTTVVWLDTYETDSIATR